MWRVIFLIGIVMCGTCAVANEKPTAYLLNLQGVIGPAMSDYISRGIAQADKGGAKLVIIMLDTPGGLATSMYTIIHNIINSSIPVITYVAPSGARAASAGTYILYASHVAAMAPATHVGAATPVSLSSSFNKSKLEIKAINDATAYIRSLAELRHRNIHFAEQAVIHGISISANQALAMKVIDVLAVDLNDLLIKINGKKVTLTGNQQVQLNTVPISVKRLLPNWRTQFLAVITDPTIAYALLLVGIYGLLFEFLIPGLVLPGVVGLISLFIALYAFQLLPVNYVGLALILAGIAFIVAEAFFPTFGALGIGGVIAFILGSILLMDTHSPGFTLLLPVILGFALVTIGYLLLIIQLAVRAQKKPPVSGREELIGSEGCVMLKSDVDQPRVRIRGELWQAHSTIPLKDGDKVRVIGIDELTLIVSKVQDKKEES
jgi:membrane-bound serine protease (ClpP class)